MDSSNISICHPLIGRHSSSIVLRLKGQKVNLKIPSSAKSLIESDVYINEHLTRHNADLARKASELILFTWKKKLQYHH